MNKIFKEFSDLTKELQSVSALINGELNTTEIKFNSVLKQYFNENAKMIRPALTLIASSYKKGFNNDDRIICASAMEFLHVATLIHDDIIDDADYRRGVKTIHHEHDIGYAVICGDYLYAKSFQLVFDTQNLDAIKYLGKNVLNMSFGEVEQYLEKFNYNLDIDKYLSIIEKKCASFFQSNLVVGAKLAGVSSKEEEILSDFGYNYGMLFQIQDDILDYISKNNEKPIQSDLKRGVYTLPLLIASKNSPELIEYLKSEFIDFKIVLNYIKETGAIEKSIAMYQSYYDNCVKCLELLNDKLVVRKLNCLLQYTYNRLEE